VISRACVDSSGQSPYLNVYSFADEIVLVVLSYSHDLELELEPILALIPALILGYDLVLELVLELVLVLDDDLLELDNSLLALLVDCLDGLVNLLDDLLGQPPRPPRSRCHPRTRSPLRRPPRPRHCPCCRHHRRRCALSPSSPLSSPRPLSAGMLVFGTMFNIVPPLTPRERGRRQCAGWTARKRIEGGVPLGRAAIVRLLLENGANVNAQSAIFARFRAPCYRFMSAH